MTLATLWLACLGAFVTACSSGNAASSASPTSGSATQVAHVALESPSIETDYGWDVLAAEGAGFYKRYNLDVSTQLASGPPATVTAVASGSVQFGLLSADAALQAVATGAPIKIISVYTYPLADVVVKNSITSWAQLAGKTAAINSPTSGNTAMLKAALEANGVSPSKLTLKTVDGSDAVRLAALEHGLVDAAVIAQPLDLEAIATKKFRSLGTLVDLVGKIPYLVTIVNSKYAAQNPGVVDRYVAADRDSIAWLADSANRDRAAQILAKASGVSLGLAEQTWDFVYKTSHGAVLSPDLSSTAFEKTYNLLKTEDSGKIPGNMSSAELLAKALDPSFLKNAPAPPKS